jgi:hypothetical protein
MRRLPVCGSLRERSSNRAIPGAVIRLARRAAGQRARPPERRRAIAVILAKSLAK